MQFVNRSLRSNIIYLYLVKFSSWFMLYMPIVVPFYQSNGLNLKELMILQACYSLSIVILEIPSGYLADALGRRLTILLGTVLGTAGFVIYSATSGFWPFLVAELTLGIGASLISGADSAILYDSLQDLKREKDYTRLEGWVTSVGNFSEAAAGIAGAFLAKYISIRAPYYFQIGVAMTGIPAAILLIEPGSHLQRVKFTMKDILGVVRYAMIENKILRRNIIYSSIIGASTLTMAWFVQPYFQLIHIPLAWYGVLWTTLNLTVALTSVIAYKVENWLGDRLTMVMITLGISLGYFAAGFFQAIWALAFFYVFYLVRGIATPVLKNYVNALTSSEIRATVLSVRSFIIRILFAGIGPFLGWYSGRYSLPSAFILAGITFLILGGATLAVSLVGMKQPMSRKE